MLRPIILELSTSGFFFSVFQWSYFSNTGYNYNFFMIKAKVNRSQMLHSGGSIKYLFASIDE